MPSGIKPALFDFVDEFSERVRQGSVDRMQLVDPSDPIITFCESFFEQFFAHVLATQIFGIDLDKTNDLVKSVVTTSATLLGLGVTIWLALVGVAVQQRLPALAYIAAAVALVFLVLDGYHGWLYARAARHAGSLERLLGMYY